jgi:hypothetical protein
MLYGSKVADCFEIHKKRTRVLCGQSVEFLGAFATISFVMSVRPPAWNNSAPTGLIFMKFDIWALFENLSRKFKFH